MRIHSALASTVLSRVLRRYPGALDLELWDGTRLHFGARPAALTVALRDARAFRDLALSRDPLRLAQAFFSGRIDVEGSIYEALGLKDYLAQLALPLRERLWVFAAAIAAIAARRPRALKAGNAAAPRSHSLEAPRFARANSDRSIGFHYDVSNAFYRLWLDPAMVYSCAYFASSAETLERAQERKLDLVCRKLRLARGESLLDIGCGWGALAIHAAKRYGVRVHAVTLSREQHALAAERVAALGLGGLVSVALADYRDLEGEARYDKIASIGMFEHVGLENLPRYFSIAHRLLKPGGLFLNHGITSREPGWRETLSTRFINRYVFPDGELDSVANVQRLMKSLRAHYALTLRHWVRRLEANREAAVREAGDSVYRVWRLYMAACALQFEQGDTGVYQILLARAGEPARARDIAMRTKERGLARGQGRPHSAGYAGRPIARLREVP
jgi:cyclopropane-fatty-acyl-phospholipid synthase